MQGSISDLIIGIVLLLIACSNMMTLAAVRGMPGPRFLFLDGALVLFAVSRFIRYKSPASPVIQPMRNVALVCFVISLFYR